MRNSIATGSWSSLPRQIRRGVLFCLVVLGGLNFVSAQEQEEEKPEISFSYDGVTLLPVGPDKGGPAVRPNSTQLVFLHITNPGPRPITKMTARLLVGRKNRPFREFAGADLNVAVGESKVIGPWKLGKEFVVPPPPAAPPPPVAPPAPAPAVVVAPFGVDLEGPAFELRLVLDDMKNKPLEFKLPIETLVPSEYVEVTDRHYRDNKLTVKLRSKRSDSFRGTACPVQLALPPRGVASLTRLQGVLQQMIEGPEQEVVLLAENLQLLQNSRFHLAVDGYQRGFVYSLDAIGADPIRRSEKELRLRFVPYLPAGDKVRVVIENDNVTNKEGAIIYLSMFRSGEKVKERVLLGPREQQVRLLAPEPDGALPVQTLVRDWVIDLDVREVLGVYAVEAVLTYKANGDTRVIRTNPARLPLLLDGTPPEGVQFLSPKKYQKVVRGEPLLIKAEGSDPESDVAEVYFFAARPTPDHKAPPDAVVVKGKHPAERDRTWVPEDPLVPPLARGRVDLGVVFVNRAGLAKSATVPIELVEPEPKSDKPKPATIVVSIREGDRPQNNLPVELRDAQGVVKQKGTSGSVKNKAGVPEDGKITFKDLPAGTYKISAVKTASNSNGEASATVKEGEEKTVEIVLYR